MKVIGFIVCLASVAVVYAVPEESKQETVRSLSDAELQQRRLELFREWSEIPGYIFYSCYGSDMLLRLEELKSLKNSGENPTRLSELEEEAGFYRVLLDQAKKQRKRGHEIADMRREILKEMEKRGLEPVALDKELTKPSPASADPSAR